MTHQSWVRGFGGWALLFFKLISLFFKISFYIPTTVLPPTPPHTRLASPLQPTPLLLLPRGKGILIWGKTKSLLPSLRIASHLNTENGHQQTRLSTKDRSWSHCWEPHQIVQTSQLSLHIQKAHLSPSITGEASIMIVGVVTNLIIGEGWFRNPLHYC